GVTGSGKTEVYLRIIEEVLASGRQALVLVPEIGLTPQLVQRFQQRFPVPIALLHSGLNDTERLNAWLMARDGSAPIVIGTRSAVFTPLCKPGVIIVDEEHDASYKQHDGFRYSARDLAVMRGHLVQVPVLLGSATPSMESLHNTRSVRYGLLELSKRAGAASQPSIRLLDIRSQPMDEGLSDNLLQVMRRHLQQNGQILLFLNRRGYAPVLMCHDCGWVGKCQRCDAHLTLYAGQRRMRCHHCASERPVFSECPECKSHELHPVGQGTERVEQALQRNFPDTEIARIDRDSTRRKGSMEAMLERIHEGKTRILVGTQMLAKGHHFPGVTLVAILDCDQGLFSVDFRASERMAQLITQVAGRAGRAEKSGEVLIQTHHPEHPLLQCLIQQGYQGFSKAILAERQAAELPPFSHMALLRAEAVAADAAMTFLCEARDLAQAIDVSDVDILGPVPAPMERRAGRFRAQLLLQATQRQDLQNLLSPWIQQLEGLKAGRKVRWSLDVDPYEMY
ncbi:MAG: primosomal protein N', partial [Gammaproteobacteria bacterium]|nr:primosomal protein N' [Gammaproteobacteria bacterium]